MREQDIIDALRKKDPQGMDQLLCSYGPLMRYVIGPILKDPQDREDCLSEAAMRIWEKIDRFDSRRGSWKAWLTAIARNSALNYARKGSSPGSEEISEDLPSPEPGPEELILLRERQAQVKKALDQLTDRDRMLFYRKYYYLQSTAQIAAELGITERAVEGKLYRLKRRLRGMLGGDACE